VGEFGRLELAVNYASVELLAGEAANGIRPLLDVTDDEYFAVFNTNVFGLFDGMKHQITATLANEDIADAVTWLCSTHASFVLGELLKVDGGLSLMT
jgi:NAD(P)-dependent dehydrogenase (short-subunit alcohol dehydrogenase family)